MIPERSIKEKILALLTVFFLFLLIGSFLFLISLNNKEKTDRLKTVAVQRQIEKVNLEILNRIRPDIFPLSTTTSKAFLTIAVTDGGIKKILNKKNIEQSLPIASITKLMVAIITLENTDVDTTVLATLDYVGRDESAFILEPDRKYKIGDLLANALISSDNDSARLLSSVLGQKNFIDKMNLKARELGLTQTNYSNVTGLDPMGNSGGVNVSTASDLANLLIYIKNKHPDILRITTQKQYNFCDTKNYCKIVANTDKLLDNPDLPFKIIGGKTGTTDLAGKNLVIVTEISRGLSIMNIVLGSENNFADTVALINNVKIEN